MNIILPIGGVGKRFKDDGYIGTKPLIKYLGKDMIFWILDGIDLQPEDQVYIVYHKDLRRYNFKEQVEDYYKTAKFNIKFIELFYQTEGAVETLVIALMNIEDINRPIMSLDCDTFYRCDVLNIYKSLMNLSNEIKDGDKDEDKDKDIKSDSLYNAVFYFKDYQPKAIYSYIKFQENQEDCIIVDIKEKVKISDNANTGCYCFGSGKKLLDKCQEILKDPAYKTKNEYYTSSVIKSMLSDPLQSTFIGIEIDAKDFVCLGTPHLLKINSQRTELIEPRRFCFDLDNTLVRCAYDSTTKTVDYTNTTPIWRNINFLKLLKSQGHTIIIQTARRMRTHSGNQGAMLADIGPITFETLSKYGIVYDEIYFGKPYAHYYIDDLAINSYYNLEKELGYYKTKVDERAHHNLTFGDTSVTKSTTKTNGLKGEIWWYNSIPKNIESYFPKLKDYDSKTFESYTIEKVDGITLSDFYLNENLTSKMLKKLLNSMSEIHDSKSAHKFNSSMKNSITYGIYLAKLDERYNNYDYSKFSGSEKIYKRLKDWFQKYELNLNGRFGIIHGDPVFTNILVTKLMRFKFIDMRGLQWDRTEARYIPTIWGDTNYDWAKIYQSLIGYDEILMDRDINLEYKDRLINIFEGFMFEHYSNENGNIVENIKWITAYQLFTLIPLHDNEKCYKYYDLIKDLII